MIYYVDEKRFEDLMNFCKIQTIYSCKIACLAKSYGLKFDFVNFWLQYDGRGNVTAAISKYCSAITLQTDVNSDIDELCEFLEFVGFDSLLSDKHIFDGLKIQSGNIMLFDNENLLQSYSGKVTFTPDLNSVYGLLCKCTSENFEVPLYEDFILDVSHRIRHKTALCAAVETDRNYVSFAMTSALSDNTALIGAVATDTNYRCKGYGTMSVMSLLGLLKQYKVFVMCEDQNESFYCSMGFKNCGKFRIYKK